MYLLLAFGQRVIQVKNTQLIAFFICFQLIFDILCYCLRTIFYFVFVTGRSQLHYTKSEFLFQLIGKPLPNHATIAWFSYAILKTESRYTKKTRLNLKSSNELLLAQREGFEPSYTFLHNTISNRARSAAPPSLQTAFILYTIPFKKSTVFYAFLLIFKRKRSNRSAFFAVRTAVIPLSYTILR